MGVTTPNGESGGRQPTMSDKKFELSRRNALIGLGTVGVASAGAGIGTSAFFSDQEEFTGNQIQAGEFGLTVEQQVHDVDQDGIGPDEGDFDSGTNGDGVWVQNPITINDAKPGDSYEFCWDITVEENPGHVALAADSDDYTGSEADKVDASELWDIDNNEELSTIGNETDVDSVTLDDSGGSEVMSYGYTELSQLLSDLEDGVLLDGADTGEGDGDPIQFEAGETYTLCIELSIPTDVGNELQGALLEWDLAVYAEQARHNDGGAIASNAAASLSDDD